MNSNVIKASLAGVAAVALLAGGTTYASWSDFSIDEGNTVGAGTLTLDVVANPNSSTTFDNLRLAPGQGKDEWVRVVSNDGDSVPNATLAVELLDLQGTEDGCNGNGEVLVDPDCADTASGGEFVRDAQIKVVAYQAPATNRCGTNVQGGGEYTGSGVTGSGLKEYAAITTRSLAAAGGAGSLTFKDSTGADAVLAPGAALCVGSSIVLPQSSDNATQGDSASFSVRFDLVQSNQPAN
ncbi:SipW-dependent-type signal peptide-containing protein [Aquipuribacter sp. MA13-6]|uniref:SipW-dependent-type signal peptide-containing protein n=1 Tax=unclassified Aquipuribacter TaxID=2635084 RepID=UPI003EEBA063